MLMLYTEFTTLIKIGVGVLLILSFNFVWGYSPEISTFPMEMCEESPPMRVTQGVITTRILPEISVQEPETPLSPISQEFHNLVVWEDRHYGFNFSHVISKVRKLQPVIDQMAESIDDAGDKKFFKQNSVWVLQEAVLYGILPSGKMAQGFLESGGGRSTLARRANNYFGVKGSRGFKLKDDEYYCPITKKRWHGKHNPKRCKGDHKHKLEQSTFVIYNTPWDSWRGHSILFQKSRYKKTRLTTNFEAYCKAIQKSGYATDIRYGRKLRGIIVKNKLFRLDELVFNDPTLNLAFTKSQQR